MKLDTTMLTKLAELKTQLESITGEKVDASAEQLIQLFFRVSLSSSEDGAVMSQSIILPGKTCSLASVLQASLLDVSSRSSTGADGKRAFLLTDFICSSNNSFAEPVNLVVTPNTALPCYATMTHALVPNPSISGAFNDVQITVLTWTASGAAAADIDFDWRCRLLSFTIFQ